MKTASTGAATAQQSRNSDRARSIRAIEEFFVPDEEAAAELEAAALRVETPCGELALHLASDRGVPIWNVCHD